MQCKETLTALKKSVPFLDWVSSHKDSYLVHIFRVMENKDWQFGFYNPDDTITTFTVSGKDVSEVPDEEIFRKEKGALHKLDLKAVSLDFSEAVSKAEELQQERYSPHLPFKTIVILQQLADGQVYNITFVTKTFNTLNVHVDSSSGKIVKEKLTPLMEMASFEKGSKDTSYIG